MQEAEELSLVIMAKRVIALRQTERWQRHGMKEFMKEQRFSLCRKQIQIPLDKGAESRKEDEENEIKHKTWRSRDICQNG